MKKGSYRNLRPETSVAGFIQLPVAGDKSIISIRDGAFSEAMSREQKR
jgi:hypothetical protein